MICCHLHLASGNGGTLRRSRSFRLRALRPGKMAGTQRCCSHELNLNRCIHEAWLVGGRQFTGSPAICQRIPH